MLVVLLAVIGLAIQMRHYQTKVLTPKNLKEATTALQSYANEAALISEQAARNRTPTNYRSVYLQNLSDQTEQITNFLTAHQVPMALHPAAQQTTMTAHVFLQTLDNSSHTTGVNFSQTQQAFTSYGRVFKRIQEGL